MSLAGWKSSEKLTEGTAYSPACFSVYSSASAAGSTLEEPGSSRVPSLPWCSQAGSFEGRSRRRQGQVSRHWTTPRKQQKGCFLLLSLHLLHLHQAVHMLKITWLTFFSLFFLPISLPALPSCLYLSPHL